MSKLDLVTKIFGVGGAKTFEKALDAKGIHLLRGAFPLALRNALKKIQIPLTEVEGSFVATNQNTFGVTARCNNFQTKLSPLMSLFDFSVTGKRIPKTPDKIAEEVAWMLDTAARQSNPRIVQSFTKDVPKVATETVSGEISKLALAA